MAVVVNMATKTDETGKKGIVYERQRSNSDPQPTVQTTQKLSASLAGYDSNMQETVSDSEKEYDPASHTSMVQATSSNEPSSPTENFAPDKQQNGEMKSGSLKNSTTHTPPVERKSKLSAFGRIFKPWKWKRRKKPSEKIEKQAVDLERKISVRTTREELIKRGVLKEVEESPQKPEDTTIPEESSKESKEEDSSVQANGTTNSDGSEPIAQPGDQTDGTLQTDPPNDVTMTVSEHTGSSVTTQAEVMSVPHNHTIRCTLEHASSLPTPAFSVSTAHFHDGVKTSSPVVDPRHIRVMLPVEDKDRHIPVVQKTKQIPVIHEKPTVDNKKKAQQKKAAFAKGKSKRTGGVCEDDPGTPVANSVGTPSGLTHSTPGLKIHPSCDHVGMGPSTPVGAYEEVPAFEPDLSKLPIRSALKGAKQQEMLQRRLHEQLAQKLSASRNSSGDSPRGAPPKTAPKPRSVRMSGGVSFMDSSNKENQPVETYDNVPDYDNLHSDDSDEEIQYADEGSGRLAVKVQRQDSLARFLNNRPHRRELIERNIIPVRSEREKQQIREAIGTRLTRRLSLRPTQEELEDRNILLRQSQEEYEREREEKKRTLVRKLSFRPTVDELKDRKIIKFSDYVEVTDAHEYDRRADKPWTRLTPRDKAAIRKELNEFKSSEMDVHSDSRHLTRFHRP